MSRDLFGYVRGLKINGETCTWEKPNIYTHYNNGIYEVSVEVGNAAYALFEYLEEEGETTSEIADGTLNIHYKMISLSSLCERLRKEKAEYKKLKKSGQEDLSDELYPQLKRLINQITVIADIGDVWCDNLYLKYYIE